MNCDVCCHVLILCLTALPSVVIAQAPGDGDSFCTNTLPNVPGVAPPVYPVNARILMDSFNYIRLLSTQTGSAWQQVDVDGIQSQGRGATWFQTADNACRQVVTACGFRDGVQNNWLITQFINRTIVDGTRLPQVSIQVEFEQEGCVEGCSRISSWHGYETSTINSVAARNISNYVLISRLVPNDGNLQNQTRYLNFATNESGFYLAIRDEDTCLAVTRVLVFYNVCPQETVEFMIRPEIISPPITTPSQEPLRVIGQCVGNASSESGAEPILTCSPGGTWSVVSGCQCNQGFRATENGTSCTEACVAGTYLSMTNDECRSCPENSVGVEPGLAVCPCVEGYYRAPREEDFPCTQPPSPVTNVRIESQTSDSVTLVWDPPVNFGGRNDTVYVLSYQEEGSNRRVEAVIVNTTMGTISGLTPGVNYQFFVTARNGVSSVAGKPPVFVSPTVNSTDGPGPIIGAILGALVAVIILLITGTIIIVVFIFRQRRNSGFKVNQFREPIAIPVKGHSTYVDPQTYACPDEAVEEFAKEIEPKMLRLDSEIGAGEFGTVYRGIWKEQPRKQVTVAIKTLKPGSSAKLRNEFLNEASIMGQFQHDHVIKLYGVVTKVEPAMIVMEFMDNGSLYSYLRKNDEKLSMQQLLKLTRGVCSGMEYLATVGYVHRDLAARNILVSKDEVCKVADFGLSREAIDDEYNVKKGGKIPVRWTAPEAIYRRKFTSSSDVWSFGVLLWEVMTYAQHPYDDWDNQTVLDQLDSGYRLERPHKCPEGVYDIMLDCWNKELSRRPTFTALLKRVDLLLNIESPPKRPPKKLRQTENSASNPLKCKSVDIWLESIKMERYIPTFQDNGVTSVNQLVHLTETDLRDMGIELAGHLHKLTQSIESGYMELKRTSSVAT